MKHKVKINQVLTEFESKLDDRQAAISFGFRMSKEAKTASDFMRSIYQSLTRFGINGMSEAQRAWVHYWAGRHDIKETVAKMPVEVDGSKLMQLFTDAVARGSRPKVWIKVGERSVKLSLAAPAGKNAGCIYIGSGDDYLGKITPDGKLLPVKQLFDNLEESLVEFCQDPKNYAIKYGKETNHCCFCGIELTTRASVFNGYGEICAENWGLPYAKPPKDWKIPQAKTETHGDV